MHPEITWYGHDSFCLSDGSVRLYIDPWQLPATVPPADIILITHEHQDHSSPDDVAKVSQPSTQLIVSPSCQSIFPDASAIMKPGDTKTIGEITIEAVEAYNPNKKFHPHDGTRVGYIVTIGGERIYHTGDTDIIPEMNSYHVDTVLIPVSGTYVMTAEEAAEAIVALKPKRAIPMHYGSIIGTKSDAERFAELVQSLCEVTILPKSEA